MNEAIEINGWKGKSGLEITKQEKHYTITEYRKDKESGISTEETHIIDDQAVYTLWVVLQNNCLVAQEYGYKYVVRKLCEHYKWHENEGLPIEYLIDAFNGGRFRRDYYFNYYYYPLKVLEHYGWVQHKGRGGVILNQL